MYYVHHFSFIASYPFRDYILTLLVVLLCFSITVIPLLDNPIHINIQRSFFITIYKLQNRYSYKKKAYADSRFRIFDSVSGSGFTFELKEPLDLPDNTIFVMSVIFQFLTHGARLELIATSFIQF